MGFRIVLKEDVDEKLNTIMENIDELNKGNEVGAWLTGDWSTEDEDYVLTLDSILIPKQSVSSTEVDMGPESMVEILKEYGQDVCNRIKAQWHIHPFTDGKTDWSSTDEQNISELMDPTKERNVFVFLLSSKTLMKGRVELNIKESCNIIGETDTVEVKTKTFDNIEIEVDRPDNNELLDELKKEFSSKITVKKYDYCYEFGEGYLEKKLSDAAYDIHLKNGELKIELEKSFDIFCGGDLPKHIVNKHNVFNWVVEFKGDKTIYSIKDRSKKQNKALKADLNMFFESLLSSFLGYIEEEENIKTVNHSMAAYNGINYGL